MFQRCFYLFCPSHTIRSSECQNEEVNGSCTGTQRISRYRLASICMNSRNGQTFSCCRRWNFREQRRCQHMGMDVVKVLTDSQKNHPLSIHQFHAAPVAVFHRKDRRLTNRPQNSDIANQIPNCNFESLSLTLIRCFH